MTYEQSRRFPPEHRAMVDKAFVSDDPVWRLTGQTPNLEATPVTDEIGELHKPIIKWLKEREWPYLYFNPTKRTHATLGWPDFSIVIPGGKTVYIECKTETGELTKEQSQLRAAFARQGMFIWIVRSWEQFAEAVAKTVL